MKDRKDKLYSFLTGFLLVATFFVVFIINLNVVLAAVWQEPSLPPPQGNVAPPLNTSDVYQGKAGGLSIGTTNIYPDSGLFVNGTATTTKLCFGLNDCKSTWNDVLGVWQNSTYGIFYNAGNVGIGLAITGPSGWPLALAKLAINTGNAEGLYISRTSTAPYSYINVRDSADKSIFKVHESGKIGLGTDFPNASLHISTTTINAEIDLQSVAGVNKHWAIYNDQTTNDLRFWNNNVLSEKNALVISDEGNIGIGTVSPGAKLEVKGQTIFGSAAEVVGNGQNLVYGNIDTTSVGNLLLLQKETVNRFIVNSNGNTTTTGNFHTTEICLDSGANSDCKTSWTTIAANSGWTDDGTIVRLTTITDNVGIGTVSSGAKLEVNGQSVFGSSLEALGVGKNLIYGNVSASAVAGNLLLLQKGALDRFLVNINGNATTTGNFHTTELCLGNDCKSAWPSIGTNYWTQIGALLYPNNLAWNVGIGTATPGSPLQIESGVQILTSGIGKGTIHLNPSGTNLNTASITFGANNNGSQVNSGQAGIYVESSNVFGTKMYFDTTDSYAAGSKQRMIIDNLGNIGIGTNNPTRKLSILDGVSGPITSLSGLNTNYRGLSLRQSSDDAENWFTGANNSNNFVVRRASSFDDLIINSSGNVGIGTVSSGAKLEVNGQSVFGSSLEALGVGKNLIYGNVSASAVAGNLLLLQKGALDRFLVNINGNATTTGNFHTTELCLGNDCKSAWPSTGTNYWTQAGALLYPNNLVWNVGIGTVNPGAKLEVNGQTIFGSAAEVVGSGQNLVYGNIDTTSLGNLILLQNESVDKLKVDKDGNLTLSSLSGGTNRCVQSDATGKLVNVSCTASNPFIQGGNSFAALATLGTNDNNSLAFKTNSIERVRIDTAGNVGIGTTIPDESLVINRDRTAGATQDAQIKLYTKNSGLAASNNPWSIYYVGLDDPSTPSFDERGDLRFWTNVNRVTFTNDGSVVAGANRPTRPHPIPGQQWKFWSEGDIGVQGSVWVYGGNYYVSGADVAEEFESSSDLTKGTVVIMGDGGYKSVKPSDKAYDQTVIGVVSDNAGMVMGHIGDDGKAQIAMVGVVGVKVTSENGAIKRGDLLVTSSLSGHAMKATQNLVGTIIGKSLEDFDGQEGNIKALINLQ